MLTQYHTSQSIRISIPSSDKVKAYLNKIDQRFVCSDKALARTLTNRLSSMTFDKYRTMREHIMEMRDISSKLKFLKVDMSANLSSTLFP